MEHIDIDIEHIFVSPGHAYFGRPKDGPDDVATLDVDRAQVVAGRGIEGDRYFSVPAHYNAQITFLAAEAVEAAAADLGIDPPDPQVLRRNVVVRGVDLNALVGADFTIDCGDGPVRFAGRRPCSPCAWMNEVIAPGALGALRGRGGLRARVESGGTLRTGRAVLGTDAANDPTLASSPRRLPRLP